MATNFVVGDRFWIPDEEHAWLVGTIREFRNAVLEFSTDKGTRKFRVNDLKTRLEHCGNHLEDNVENLVDLDELSEGAILHHVRNRFARKTIYTHVGNILVAVNPFEVLGIYGERDIRRAVESAQAYPHVFVTSNTAYQQLINNCKNQSVLISGESGAGKTETTKKVLAFLANVAPDMRPSKTGSEVGMETKILQSNPLLEALGNAKTLRNNNSSRFGKWMKVGFTHGFKIQGCEIVNYLLEKSRVVKQSAKERNYHIFYQLLAGADAAMRQRLFLRTPTDYRYLDQSGCVKIEGVDDVLEYRDVIESMKTLQFPLDVIENIFKVIAGILHLGNIQFEVGHTTESCKILATTMDTMRIAGELLGLHQDMFAYSLTEKKVQMGKGSIVGMKLSAREAEDSRDTLAKTLYSNLFDWIIARVNVTLRVVGESPYFIGILDIFGFEVFELNSFEQLCINYANEKLQLHFNEVIFSEETKMYMAEGVPLDKVNFDDNSECVNLIEGKPYSLLALLEEECSLGAGTDLSYLNKAEKKFGTGKDHANKYFLKNKTKPECFSVYHFAGAVEYNVTNFLEKNKDTLSLTSREVMEQSSVPLVTELFVDMAAAAGGGAGGSSKKQTTKSTLGAQFRNQLIGLVGNLRQTEPHFIRCVKPNHAKIGGQFDGNLALRQLRYAGLFEAIRIRKSGFAYRSPFRAFANAYQILVDGLTARRKTRKIEDRDACLVILRQVTAQNLMDDEAWQVGTTKVFLKTNSHRTILERQKIARDTVFAVRIQRSFRDFRQRKAANAEKYRLAKERLRQQQEAAQKSFAAVCMQKYWRRFLVTRMMASMQNLVELRRVLAKREIDKVRDVLHKIDATGCLKRDNFMFSMFAHEVKIARVMLRLIEIQDKLVDEIAFAIDNSDVPELNRLLVKADRLEMTAHPVVLRAREELVRLHHKRRVLKTMVAFLRNEDEYGETIVDTLDEARQLSIDRDFIAKVQRVYDSAGPRLKTRNKLRGALESLDRYSIEQGCLEVLGIRHYQPNFAESEMRAAKTLLQLLHFDSQLDPNFDISVSASIEPAISYVQVAEERRGRTRTRTRTSSRTSSLGRSRSGSRETTSDGGGGEKGTDASNSSNADGADDAGTAAANGPPAMPTSLWGAPLLSKPTGPKLTRELQAACAAVVSAEGAAAISAAKKNLQEVCGSVSKFYEAIRYYKWTKCNCTWRFPETHGQSSVSRLKRAAPGAAAADASPGSPESSPFGLPVQSQAAEVVENEFYGLRLAEARGTPYVIRTLHLDFDPFTGKGSGLMQAAMSGVDLPHSIRDTLTNLDHLGEVDLNITLPNGQQFVKTKKRNAFNDDDGVVTAPTRANYKAPMPAVPMKIVSQLPDSSPEKKLYLSRKNKERQLKVVTRDLEIVRREKGLTSKGWK